MNSAFNWQGVWKAGLIIVGTLISAVGYLIEQRLASIESQIHILDSRVDTNAAKIEGNTEAIIHLREKEDK